jgi:hypothetical protein
VRTDRQVVGRNGDFDFDFDFVATGNPQGPTIVGTGNGTPEVPELSSAWGYTWATLSPEVINTER